MPVLKHSPKVKGHEMKQDRVTDKCFSAFSMAVPGTSLGNRHEMSFNFCILLLFF